MIVELTADPVDRIPAEILVVFLHADDRPPVGAAGLLDWRLNGALSRQIKVGWYRAARGEALLVAAGRRAGAPRVLVMGLGPKAEADSARLREVAAAALDTLARIHVTRMAFALPPAGSVRLTDAERATAVVEGLLDTVRGPNPPEARPQVVLAVPLEAQADTAAALTRLKSTVGAGYHLDLRPIAAATRPAARVRLLSGAPLPVK